MLQLVLAVMLSGTAPGAPAAAKRAAPRFPEDRMIWGIGGGGAISHGDLASGFGSVMLRMDRIATRPGGPGWLRGQLGYSVELVPLFLLFQGETVYAGGFNLIGRHYLGRSAAATRPFVTLGAGLLLSRQEVPHDVANVNFTPQIGFGLLFAPDAGPLYSLELRLHHISNGGRAEPNPGINSVFVQLGVSFPGP